MTCAFYLVDLSAVSHGRIFHINEKLLSQFQNKEIHLPKNKRAEDRHTDKQRGEREREREREGEGGGERDLNDRYI